VNTILPYVEKGILLKLHNTTSIPECTLRSKQTNSFTSLTECLNNYLNAIPQLLFAWELQNQLTTTVRPDEGLASKRKD
jgi:hypothetical protein